MAYRSSFPQYHEIVEIQDELNPSGQYKTNHHGKPELKRDEKIRSPATNFRHISPLEEDLNQLFEVFSHRASQASSSKKSASKRPVIPNGSYSPKNGVSERGNLKQALRGLCLSQASEMAAMRRSTRTSTSSKAGKIMTLYRNVVEDEHSDNGKASESFRNSPENMSGSDSWHSNRSSLVERETRFTQMDNESLSSPHVDDNSSDKKRSPSLLPSLSSTTAKNSENRISSSNMIFSPVPEFGSQTSLTDSLQTDQSLSSSCSGPTRKTAVPKEMSLKENGHSPCRSDPGHRDREHGKSGIRNARKLSASAEFASQKVSIELISKDKHELFHSSPSSNGKTSLELASRRISGQKEKCSFSVTASNQTKDDVLHEDDRASNKLPRKESVGKSDKVEYESSKKAVKKDSSKNSPLTGGPKVKNKKGSKSIRHTPHFVKPLVKTKTFVKRKSKKNTASHKTLKNKHCEFDNDLYTSSNPLVCPRCQCAVTNAWKEAGQDSPVSLQEYMLSSQDSPISYQDSPVSPFASLSAEVSSGNVISDVSTRGRSSESLNKATTVVTEGNLGRPSFCDRPHKSKDVRWEAIYRIRSQHGTIGLRNFNLLKKLGCGDIGTVYLGELIGTDCQFAIKVMDNEFLVRRKKMSRAQTEREILRMLDHPFLPTLYCQFTSDNLSCLVMEYCPGGDLHVLRQRQPGRCFTEHAARFYVAEVLLALEYLHMLGVIYRDLKPENILVREDGHIMLSDFDLSLRCVVNPMLLISSSKFDRSKNMTRPSVDSRCAQPLCIEPSCQVTCFTPRKLKSDAAAEMRPLLQLVAEPTTARSNSFVGTHEYLAPEIIKGEGHGSAVDWWTLGIFLYELLYGRTPFKGTGNDETLANVVLQTLKFPDSPLVSLQARDLIATLLVKEPENRLGTERGAADIKQHPFFDGLNWALIRCTVPPELPEPCSYGMPKVGSLDSGSGEQLEFEVF